ncbi:hypothetical protein OG339_48410 (plasmid) [Streptosporangium sp. NBC_01495]|uniref:hypothetical protein n=1 Tax=Streptosporangium sp. NBC_01495 TaxID=2903899 RepID=UPI002E31A8CE|nr:hypothetical protein [Streptosporangium sp. NBC_01495]
MTAKPRAALGSCVLTAAPGAAPDPLVGMTLPSALRHLGVVDVYSADSGTLALLNFATSLSRSLLSEDYTPMLDLVRPLRAHYDGNGPELQDVVNAIRLWLSGPVLLHWPVADTGELVYALRRIAAGQARLEAAARDTFVERLTALLDELRFAPLHATHETAPAAFAMLGTFLKR